eukprot:scaffold73850_cov22-Prasinocladus_malaysianus.AAC.1
MHQLLGRAVHSGIRLFHSVERTTYILILPDLLLSDDPDIMRSLCRLPEGPIPHIQWLDCEC